MSKSPQDPADKWKQFTEEQANSDIETGAAEASDDSLLDDKFTDTDLLGETTDTQASAGLELTSRQDLEQQLNQLEEQLAKYKDKSARDQAELKNVQRRAERDVSNAHKYGSEKIMVEMLQVVDSIERGLETSMSDDPKVQSLHEGMQLTLDLLIKTLNKFGVEIIDPAAGDNFNPELHEAMSMQPDKNAKSNTVLQVLQKGYQLNGRVLRAAMVIVAA
ncbi:MAG: nucleotide exchange factor GrpE [Gammaproteobacteria bacterium]|nr:nucleotide exchange factor GrpE [Gammaproteobacteria bacterium]